MPIQLRQDVDWEGLVSSFFDQLRSGVQHPNWDGGWIIRIESRHDPRLYRGIRNTRPGSPYPPYPVEVWVEYLPSCGKGSFCPESHFSVEDRFCDFHRFNTYEEAVSFAVENGRERQIMG